jgi:hypothetical protein
VSLLLYAISDTDRALDPELRGVGGAPVQSVSASGLVAVASEHDAAPALDEEALWSFDDVIETLMSAGAVLPMRFGTTVATADEIVALLERRRADLTHRLDRVRGAVELSVRGVWPHSSETVVVAATTTGTSCMQDRLAPQRRARELAAQVHARLDGLARASRHRLLPRASMPVSSAFLIDRGTEDEFVGAVQQLDAHLDGADLVCTGPWPAYSFVGGALDE